jgi:hypothetical protein
MSAAIDAGANDVGTAVDVGSCGILRHSCAPTSRLGSCDVCPMHSQWLSSTCSFHSMPAGCYIDTCQEI